MALPKAFVEGCPNPPPLLKAEDAGAAGVLEAEKALNADVAGLPNALVLPNALPVAGVEVCPKALPAVGVEDCPNALPDAGVEVCPNALPDAGVEVCPNALPVAGAAGLPNALWPKALPVPGVEGCPKALPVAGVDVWPNALPVAGAIVRRARDRSVAERTAGCGGRSLAKGGACGWSRLLSERASAARREGAETSFAKCAAASRGGSRRGRARTSTERGGCGWGGILAESGLTERRPLSWSSRAGS